MKSGLKDTVVVAGDVVGMVATYAAMKSGLKGLCVMLSLQCADGSNLCRDEKRTESCPLPPSRTCRCVATYAAMKSGLKGQYAMPTIK